jgi:hypothetical protein
MKGMSFSQLPFKLCKTLYRLKKVEKRVFVDKINPNIGNFSLLQICVFKLGFLLSLVIFLVTLANGQNWM